MLVVVEHGDVAECLQPFLDLEAVGRLDVLQVDPAEGRGDGPNGGDHLIHRAGIQLDVDRIDVGELLEEVALALHDRLRGQWADVSEPEHRRAVGHHCDEVSLGGVFVHVVGARLDGEARLSDAGRIGEREIALGEQRLGRNDLDFSRTAVAVVVEGIALEAHRYSDSGAGISRRRTHARFTPSSSPCSSSARPLPQTGQGCSSEG